MNANRLTIAIAVLAAIAIAVATASFAPAPKASTLNDDFALRHPAGLPGLAVNAALYYRGTDYVERHPGSPVVDISDFYLRHPEWTTLSPVIDTSDYFLRHPELWGQ